MEGKSNRECCRINQNIEMIKEYNPQPKNRDGSIRWFLYRWDDGKSGVRGLVRCKGCGALYLVQAYHLHKFAEQKNTLYEDFYLVESEQQADYFNRSYTGIQLELTLTPALQYANGELIERDTQERVKNNE